MHFTRHAPFAGAIVLALCGSTQAATAASTTFGVSASVAANCLVTANNNAFGSYDGTAAKSASQDLKVRCTNNLPYTVKLSSGGGSFAQRLLSNGTDTLQYNLFTQAGFTTVWGDGTGGTVSVPGVGAGMSATKEQTHTIFGSLPNSAANQDAPVGSYTDTITVTVEY